MNDLVVILSDLKNSVSTIREKVEENNILALEILKLIRSINEE